MQKYPDRHVIFLVSFDGQSDRADKILENAPGDFTNRVFSGRASGQA
jgi:hypothetical protein